MVFTMQSKALTCMTYTYHKHICENTPLKSPSTGFLGFDIALASEEYRTTRILQTTPFAFAQFATNMAG